jgi:hypothetical protein
MKSAVLSQQQWEKILDNIFQTAHAVCPKDGTSLEISFAEHKTGYDIKVICPSCGLRKESTRDDDPRQPSFRDWTDAEMDASARNYSARGWSVCPVDDTPLRPSSNTPIILNCKRCGKRHSSHLPPRS